MLHAAYRSIMRKLPVSMKAPIKRIGLSFVGSASAPIVESPAEHPQISEPVTPPIDPVQSRMEFESYFQNARLEISKWAHNSRENDNFTYELTEQNLDYLAATISTVTGASLETIHSFLKEPITGTPAQELESPFAVNVRLSTM